MTAINNHFLRHISSGRWMSLRIKVLVNLALVYISWGSTYIGFKFGLTVLGPFMVTGLRMASAGTLVFLFLMATNRLRLPSRADLIHAIWFAVFTVVMASGFICKGQEYISSGVASVVSGSTPISMLLGVWLFAGERRPTLLQCLGLAGGFTGLVLIGTAPDEAQSTSSLTGMLWVLGATFGWVTGTVITKRSPSHSRLSPFESCGLLLFFGGLECLLIGLLCGESQMVQPNNITPQVCLAFAWLVIGCSIAGYYCYFWLLNHVSTSLAISYEYVIPVLGIFFGWWLGGEHPGTRVLCACALVICSVIFVVQRR